MQTVCPSYYPRFQCIAGKCQHSCCIGWEIDIDPDTMDYYRSIPGQTGQLLSQYIAPDDPPHFILSEGERCPFLTKENLCRLILTLGEGALCEICAEHPRFYRELSDRTECGLGLCCEEAARLILSWSEPVTLLSDGDGSPSPFTAQRDEGIRLLQDRSQPISRRVEAMLNHFSAPLPTKSPRQWAQVLLGLERMDEAWTVWLTRLQAQGDELDLAGFDAYMTPRQGEYEQLLVYLLYRHLNEDDPPEQTAARACFAALGYEVIRALGALYWTEKGALPFSQQVEFVRLFSCEVEYSEENTSTLLKMLPRL